ncbi:hypothetical protein ACEUAI_13140 [Aeromonas veronii]
MTVIASSSGVYANSADEKISLAKNPMTSPTILDALCLEDSPVIARCVAQNPNSSVDALLYLSKKKDYTLRHDALANPGIGADKLIEILPESESSDRSAIAMNAALPMLNRLMLAVNDESVLVRKAAWSWIESNSQLAWHEAVSGGIGLAFEMETINGRQTLLDYLQRDGKVSLIEELLSIELNKKLSTHISLVDLTKSIGRNCI